MKERDIWDKLDIVGKFFTGVIIGLITIYLAINRDRITQTFNNAQLTEKLLIEITDPDNTRRDLAVSVLYHTVRQTNKPLVIDILKSIYQSSKAKSNECLIAKIYLEELDPIFLENFEKETLENLKNSPRPSQIDSFPVKNNNTYTSMRVENNYEQAAKVVTERLVYIQYNEKKCQEKVKEIRKEIQKNYFAPGIDFENGNYGNQVKYFNPEDKALAEELSQQIQTKFKISLQIHYIQLQKIKVPQGQIELWLNSSICN